MIKESTRSIIERSRQIYEPMRTGLEIEHTGKYVAIEPDSGDTFIAESFDDAVSAARSAHPNCVTHTIRIGHCAVFHIGLMEQFWPTATWLC